MTAVVTVVFAAAFVAVMVTAYRVLRRVAEPEHGSDEWRLRQLDAVIAEIRAAHPGYEFVPTRGPDGARCFTVTRRARYAMPGGAVILMGSDGRPQLDGQAAATASGSAVRNASPQAQTTVSVGAGTWGPSSYDAKP
jgi:hypothetical protein